MVTSRPRQRPSQRSSGSRSGRVLDFRPVPSARLLAVYLILCTGLVGLAARLAWVQVVQGPQLLNRARARLKPPSPSASDARSSIATAAWWP